MPLRPAESYNYLIPTRPLWGSTIVEETDPAIAAAGTVQFTARDGATLSGYAAKPATQSAPADPGDPENRALTTILRTLLVDSPRKATWPWRSISCLAEGGSDSFPDPAAISAALTSAGTERHVGDFSAGIDYLLSQPRLCKVGVGVTGYCFGGGQAWRIAVEDERVAAAVPYYGTAPPLEKVPTMRAAAFGVYAADDERINQSAIALEEALKANGKTYAMKQYPGHWPRVFQRHRLRYSADQAREAWSDTIAWFRQHLPTA